MRELRHRPNNHAKLRPTTLVGLWLCLCCCFAGQAQTLDRDAMAKLDLQRYLRSGNLETINAGEDEYLILLQESTIPVTKGVAIMVTDAGKPHLSHLSLYPLAQRLNGYGWVTVLFNGPDLFEQLNPEQAETPDSDVESDNRDPIGQVMQEPRPIDGFRIMEQGGFDQQQQRIQLAIDALTGISRRYRGFYLMIAEGTSAAWLSNMYANGVLGTPDALIAISPYWPDDQRNKAVADLLARTPAPVLDLYSPWDNDWIISTAEQRRIAATKNLKLHYRQRELVGQPMDEQQFNYMAKEIYGWLSHMGW